ncbi:MAG: hypothetical protein QXR57_07430 [Metallosphaera sp.]|uniref:hypothetical protein n=1 Tax=Metallosphaera sp. TaxID=2020860 RepID=UPI003167F2CD
MMRDDEVLATIQRLYNGKPVSLSKLRRKFESQSELVETLERLEREGKVKSFNLKGSKGYAPNLDKFDLILAEISSLNSKLNKLHEMIAQQSRVKVDNFDEIYDKIKDNLGYAHLQAIRVEMGLTKEEFYSSVREHVESHYDLIAGGEEGYVRRGSVYGIVKRRR